MLFADQATGVLAGVTDLYDVNWRFSSWFYWTVLTLISFVLAGLAAVKIDGDTEAATRFSNLIGGVVINFFSWLLISYYMRNSAMGRFACGDIVQDGFTVE